ncbi:MAG: RHS repeat-associated core domain-containing protein [Verrucomicrobiae bacterium]|nr:RHS repeat-associated core domain-containing protein [Verrucomicrobiae bacterium]
MTVRVPWQEGLVGFLDQAGVEILRYTYDPNSRLTNRWSKAKGNTIYSYDPVGNLTNVNYPSSPDVRFAYDPLNRVTNMVDAAGTTKYAYTAGGQLWTEDGPWSNETLTNTYTYRMRTGLALQQPTGTWTNGFWHDYARRLTNVTSPAGSFDYLFAGVTHHASRLTLPNTSYITNHYDNVARLLFTKLNNSSHTTLNKHEYLYNTGHQRTKHTRTDDSHLTFSYDPIGQLTIARATNSGGSLLSGETKGYFYDAAWNLNRRTNNSSGSTHTFNVDVKNQLTNATPVGTQLYDDNGNVTYNDAYYGYSYDDENQLVNWYYYGGGYDGEGSVTSSEDWRTDFVYDGRGRLRQRVEYQASGFGSNWEWVSETRYVYDGMRVIQERAGNNTPTVGYTRGSDLSGTLEGAGGIGGLLGRSHGYTFQTGNWSTHNYYHADGGGNVTYLVNSSQTLAASYKYDAYGNLATSPSGSLAGANVYRFSSKESHAASGLYCYGYRWYAPNLQRWLNRDPLGELGFELLRRGNWKVRGSHQPNLYVFVHNVPTSLVDSDGRAALPILVAILVEAAWQATCKFVAMSRARATFPDDDKQQHCYAACFHNRCTLGLSPNLTFLGGVWHEIVTGGGGDWRDALDDIRANIYGIIHSYSFESCENACKKCPVK